MTLANRAIVPSAPRWDGRRVLFDFVDGGELVECAISRGALEDLSGRRQSAGVGLLVCFEAARERIDSIARAKHKAHLDRAEGVLNIFADDVEDEDAEEADAPGDAVSPPAGA